MKGFARNFGMLWGSVFIQAWLKSDWTFKSMQARGFAGDLKTVPKPLRLSLKEVFMLAMFLLAVTLPNFISMLR